MSNGVVSASAPLLATALPAGAGTTRGGVYDATRTWLLPAMPRTRLSSTTPSTDRPSNLRSLRGSGSIADERTRVQITLPATQARQIREQLAAVVPADSQADR